MFIRPAIRDIPPTTIATAIEAFRLIAAATRPPTNACPTCATRMISSARSGSPAM
ncbi:MAG: hypothetical protein MK082_13260 [Phycisphaerales bacterium]|nr:hypothetical protein [Phycisphaerales bacterium]